MTDAAAHLVLGPLLRYNDQSTAAVWVETSAPAELGVLGRTARTFEVLGHHYGYLVLDGLEVGTDVPYEVALDGRPVWPEPGDHRPPPRLRTHRAGELDVVFGSCRTDRPHERPFTLTADEHPDGVGVDALHALSLSLQAGERPLPDLLLLLGDQVYADEGMSPNIRERQVERRGADADPVGEVADFEEYTWLYQDSWSDPEVRWLLATVPSAMIFDDHDVRDDWNTSAAWRDEVRRLPWWHDRVVGAYASYWLYQHLGNLRPSRLEEEGVLAAICDEGGDALVRYAERADEEVEGGDVVRWSYGRELGVARLVVVDTRSGRNLREGARQMLNDDEWDLVEGFLRGDVDHLIVASSLPLVLERSLHDLEGWTSALCEGRWGRRGARLGERIRQGADLEHWAAFPASFTKLVERLREVGAGRRGRAPATILVLSGDVHHSYVAPLEFDDDDGVSSAVVQVVSSPFRNALPKGTRRLLSATATRPGRLIGRALARSVREPRPPVRWSLTSGVLQGNGLGVLRLDGAAAEVTLERAHLDGDDRSLVEVLRERLDPGADAAPPGRAGR